MVDQSYKSALILGAHIQVTGVAAPGNTLGETATQKLEGSSEKPPTPMAVKCIIEMSKIDSRRAQTKAWLLQTLVALLRFGNGVKNCV